ncbi:MAG: B12-binding domain-containing radical SAM protein [Candidatus Omnitrophica bacterium]|nr:B12-binding domain-containing radical SAM protein [Candidatus Omnitrophota bacterium]
MEKNKNIKVLLVRPPSRHVEGSAKPSAGFPLGLLYLAAVLEKNSCQVKIYDAQINAAEPVYPQAEGVIHMGDNWEVVREKIEKNNPDLVGITCSFSTQMDNTIKTAEIVKGINKKIITVVGGPHATVRPEDFLIKTKAIDIVVRGEGEYILLDIVRAIEAKTDFRNGDGIVFNDGGSIKINQQRHFIEDLDELPFPAYHLINLEDYFSLYVRGFTPRPVFSLENSHREVSLITSRGCPFNCIFCSIHLHMGKKWRFHSAGYVLRHLSFLESEYAVKHIHFEDDNLTLDINRFNEILNGILSKNLRINWDTPNGIRADRITKDIVTQCKKTGCVYLIFGVESGNQYVLDNIICKSLNLEHVERAAIFCKEASIDAGAFFVIGFPGETSKQMDDTVNFALRLQKKYDVFPGLFIATPLPGTRLEKVLKDKGIAKDGLSSEELAKMTQGCFAQDSDAFTAKDIEIMLKKFYQGLKINFVYNCVKFFLFNPVALVSLFSHLWNLQKTGVKVDKKLLIGKLEYKNCFKKPSQRRIMENE